MLSDFGIMDLAYRNYRDRDTGPDTGGVMCQRRFRLIHGGDNWQRRPVDAPGNMERVDAGLFQEPGKFTAFLRGDPPFHTLIGIHPEDHRKITAYGGADGIVNLNGEAAPAGGRAAVFIGALIAVRRKKLVDQIAMGPVNFYGVKARFAGAAGGVAEGFDNALNFLDGQGAGHIPADGTGDFRGGHRLITGCLKSSLPAGVVKLDCRAGAVLPD